MVLLRAQEAALSSVNALPGYGHHGKLLSLCYGGFVILLVIGNFLFFSDAFKSSLLLFFSILFVCLLL